MARPRSYPMNEGSIIPVNFRFPQAFYSALANAATLSGKSRTRIVLDALAETLPRHLSAGAQAVDCNARSH